MSEFVTCETKITSRKLLIEALIDIGWTREEIEVHDEAQHLYGYLGDRRKQKANVIIRRQHIGGSSNDIGFLKRPDGSYEAVISEYDRTLNTPKSKEAGGFNEKWIKGLTGVYNKKVCIREMKKLGFTRFVEQKKGKKTIVRCVRP